MQDFMTVKEITDLLGVTRQTILNHIRKVYPGIIQHGKQTRLNKDQATEVIKNIKIEVSKELTVESKELTVKNDQANIISMFSEMQKQNHEFMKMMLTELKQIRTNQQPQQIEIKQDYYSILGYCRLNNIEIRFSDAISFGRTATKISKEDKKEIKKIPDERFGQVNSYSVDVLDKVFSL